MSPLMPLSLVTCAWLATAAAAQSSDPAVAFKERHGQRLMTRSDDARGVLLDSYGRAIPLHARSAGLVDIAVAADRFVAANADLLGADLRSLARDDARELPLAKAGLAPKISVVYRQTAFGLPVLDATLCLVLDARGDLLALQNHLVPLAAGESAGPRIGAADARAAAAAAVGFDGHHEVRELELLFAEDRRQTPARARLAYLVHLFRPTATGVPEGYRILIDAADGSFLDKQSTVFTADLIGHVGAKTTQGLKPDGAGNPPVLVNMKDLSLGSPVGTGLSDAAGSWTIPYGGSDVQSVTADLDSPLVRVTNVAGANESLTLDVTPGVFADFTLNASPTELVTAQPNCHEVAIRFHDFIKDLDPSDGFMDFTVKCNVNLAQTCNAYYDYSSINFFRSGGGCPNTVYSTVIAHEEGHWANSRYNGGVTGAFHEGLADVWSMYIHDTPIIGQDFFGPGSFIRTGDNGTLYCGNCSENCHGGEPHFEGEVAMGAFWKMRKRLDASLGDAAGDLVADALLLSWFQAFNQLSICEVMTQQLLTLDDDNGDIFDGTPHHQDINGGFTDQGFPGIHDKKVNIAHAGVGEAQGLAPVPVTAVAECPYGEPVTQMSVWYSSDFGGGFAEVPMAPTGNPNEWQASIPGLPALTSVFYYFTGATSSGLHGTLPASAPDNDRFIYHVGALNTVVHYDFETGSDEGFTHGATVGADDWEHGAPQGLSVDPAAASSGERVWGNDLSVDGSYGNSTSTWLQTPPLDLTGVLNTRLAFRRWLSVEGALWDQARILVNGVPVYLNPEGSGTLGDVVDRDWTHQTIDISAVADNQSSVVVRFELDTDFTTAYGGWNLDDLRVIELVDPQHDCKPSFNYGTGSAGSGGFTPRIFAVNGPASLGNSSFRLEGDRMLGGSVAALVLSAGKAEISVGPLTILVDLTLPHVFLPVSVGGSGAGNGTAGVGLPIPSDSAFDGIKFYAQWMVTDAGGFSSLALSDGLQTEICASP